MRWPADDCFCTGLMVMTSSLSLPAVGGKKWSTIWCSLIGLSSEKPVQKNCRSTQKERSKLKISSGLWPKHAVKEDLLERADAALLYEAAELGDL